MIAIIGEPGAGKTFTIKLLEKKGFSILIADDFFKSQYLFDNEGYNIIKNNLGIKYVDKKSVIIEKLREYSINNMDNLEKLIHPLLENHLKLKKYDFVEIPILNSTYCNFNQYFTRVLNIINTKESIKKEIISRKIKTDFYNIILAKQQKNYKVENTDIESGNINKIINLIK